MKESLDFYNKFDKKLIEDYVLGNKRIESAVGTLPSFIPNNATQILDIGCGIGWSSHEFSKLFPTAKINGIDLSPVLIERAATLFQNSNLSFDVFDLTVQLPKVKYDAVFMIDVYEHIPVPERTKFHAALRKMINDKGRLILACPSKYHQNWLRTNKPEGLQPVDEDVDNTALEVLAKEINGEVIYFEYQKIWNGLDYFYAVIEVNPEYGGQELKNKRQINLETRKSRSERVADKLGVKIEPRSQANKKGLFGKIKNKLRKIVATE